MMVKKYWSFFARDWSVLLLVILVIPCGIVAGNDSHHDLLVDTSSGPFLGKYMHLSNGLKVRAFLGIPYAEPPVGDFRFKPPIAKRPMKNVFNATSFGPFCYQPTTQTVWDIEVNRHGKKMLHRKRLKDYPMNEDCLSLNIYAPVVKQSENPLTVMVYFHGGSYYMNGGRLYPGEKLASLGVIIVTFNYRLGPLGFLSTEDEVSPGNYGLLDQVLVLKWVKKNIGHFDGDPNNVCIYGNSAGGASVSFHLLSPLSEGLLVPFAPVVDGFYGGDFLPDYPDAIMSKGNYHGTKVPFLTGVTKDEVSIWFQNEGAEMNVEDMRAFMQKRAKELLKNKGVSDVNQAVVLHAIFVQYLAKRGMKSNKGKGQTMAVVDFISDVGIKAPCVQFLQNFVESALAPVYMYEFSYFSEDDARSDRQQWIGAYHESELQFLFGEPFIYNNSLGREKDRQVSDMMMKLWINFAKYGDPTHVHKNPLNFSWSEYTADHQVHLRLMEAPSMSENYLTESVLFWNAFVPILSDYPIHETRRKCVGVKKKWLLWTMVPIICIQTIVCITLCFYTFRRRRHLATHTPLSTENGTAV